MPDAFSARSGAFDSGDPVPAKYTCEGANVSPPFTLNNVPDEAQSIAVIADDPDAPGKTFVHWVVFNLPADTNSLPEDLDLEADIEGGSVVPAEGVNDFGDLGYGGPCPPPGSTHNYHFRFYALDATLELENGATKKQLTQAMDGHVLAEADVIGSFQRSG